MVSETKLASADSAIRTLNI